MALAETALGDCGAAGGALEGTAVAIPVGAATDAAADAAADATMGAVAGVGASGSGTAGRTTTAEARRGRWVSLHRMIVIIESATTTDDATATPILRISARRPVRTVRSSAALRTTGRVEEGSGRRRIASSSGPSWPTTS